MNERHHAVNDQSPRIGKPRLRMLTAMAGLPALAVVYSELGWTSAQGPRLKTVPRNHSRPTPTGVTRLASTGAISTCTRPSSPDAGLVGDRLGPDDAFRFARGEQLRSSTGQLVQLERPYDWLVVSDHAEYLGFPRRLQAMDPDILKTESGKKWAEALKKGGKAGYEAFVQMTNEFADGQAEHSPRGPGASCTAPSGTVRSTPPSATTSPACSPPSTASSGRKASRATISTGSSSFATAPTGPSRSCRSRSSTAPTPRTCGSTWPTTRRKPAAACWPSRTTPTSRAGRCSPPRPGPASPLTRNTPPLRARFERLAEASQSKGDSETTPQLSPNDQFANFERWNKANIFGLIATTPEMLPFNYCRSALKLGLEHEAKLGVNPFKFGLIGGSDSHTSLSTTRAENYFGVGTIAEPKPDRWKEYFIKSRSLPQAQHLHVGDGRRAAWAASGRARTPARRSGTRWIAGRSTAPAGRGRRCASSAAGTSRPRTWATPSRSG